MMKSKGCLRKNIKKALSALAYEHSGEMLSRTSKNQVLSGAAVNRLARKKIQAD